MKCLVIAITAALLAGCATSGKVVNTQFIDSKYPLSITFPKDYQPKPSGKNSEERVAAVEYKREMNIISGLILLKPVFVISLFEKKMPFEEFIKKNADRHFEPRYYFDKQVEFEENVQIGSRSAHLIHIVSKVATDGDNIVTIKGNNKGIIGFVDHGDYYSKIEYIANTSKYRKEDFDFVLNNIIIK